jgi:hypothetical protein
MSGQVGNSERPQEGGFVYFIQAVRTGKIKIGFTVNPKSRLRSMQTGSSSKLKLLSLWPATRAAERKLHEYFAEYRRDGEWFQMVHPDVALIQAIIGAAETPISEVVYSSAGRAFYPSSSVTIYDAPNVCRGMMAACAELARRLENKPELAAEIREIGDDVKRMLDAIIASVDQILAIETAAPTEDAA